MKIKTRKIRRLWNGYASLRDYEVEEAINKNLTLVLVLDSKRKMTLTPEDLKRGSQLTRKVHDSQFGGAPYILVDFKWVSDKRTEGGLF